MSPPPVPVMAPEYVVLPALPVVKMPWFAVEPKVMAFDAVPVMEPKVWSLAFTSKMAAFCKTRGLPSENTKGASIWNVPFATVMVPVKVPTPEKPNVPDPVFVKLPDPPMIPAKVVLVLFPPIVRVDPAPMEISAPMFVPASEPMA